jgi:septum formation protein
VHRVHTGLALHAGRQRPIEVEAVSTEVRFRTLDDEEINAALESGEWAGAAGGYRIQERGAFLVEWIRGSWSNVVGLPLEAFYGMLRRTGYRF